MNSRRQPMLELNLHVTYKRNGTPIADLHRTLVEAAEHLADNGLLTGDTAAEVLECTHEVTGLRRPGQSHPLDLRRACLRLLQAAEGLDSLYDDESRAEAYASELEELSQAKDQAREALAIGIPTRETVNRNARNQATTDATCTL